MNTSLRRLLCLAAVFTAFAIRAATPGEEMAFAANNFLAALTPEQKAKATFDFKNDERLNWHFIPKERKGITLKELTPPQRHLATALLTSGLSQRGLIKANSIMSLEAILAELEGPNRKMARDPEGYHLWVFGTPGPKGAWGWRWEGHHMSFNFTLVDGKEISGAPNFMGTNPAEVRQGPRAGLRVLAAEQDIAHALYKSLSDEQRKAATLAGATPKDIITVAERKVKPLEPAGLSAAKLSKEQHELLVSLVKEYAGRLRPELTGKELEKIQKAGWDKVTFAWAGSPEPGVGEYYRVQGPTFLIEYDNTQNQANHVHAVWRDFNGDFGEDILAKHYADSHAK